MSFGCKNFVFGDTLYCVFAWSLFLILSIGYFTTIGWKLAVTFTMIPYIIHIIFSVFVAMSFATACFMEPGYPYTDECVQVLSPVNQIKTTLINNVEMPVKWCRTCLIYRTPRMSHCDVCRRCVDTFDHHCPWINNCVGRRNYRYFLYFVSSLFFHAVLCLTACGLYIYFNYKQITSTFTIIAIVLGIFALGFMCPVGTLMFYHVFLITIATTSYEYVNDRYAEKPNPFNNGCASNWATVFCSAQLPILMPNYGDEDCRCDNVNLSIVPVV